MPGLDQLVFIVSPPVRGELRRTMTAPQPESFDRLRMSRLPKRLRR